MYLKHLTINGFKSFAKKSELEFSAPITAVVGPNGSGKSNVAESFRFVLGEQSPSKMRGKKGEDLIWGGSEQVSRGNRASVSITLDNQKRVFPLDFDEIILERTVHRDGQNEYSINGSKVRLKDVQEVLAAANVGPTGHHIISQGEADRILSASKKERREMIEDALGLKLYQFKKNEAEKKLQKTKENIERVESLRREVAPHLRFLEKQMKKMERRVEVRTQLETFYVEYLKREDTYLAFHQDHLKQERQEPARKLETLRLALASAKKTLEEAEHGKESTELLAAEGEVAKARGERQELLRHIGQVEGQIGFLERRIKSLKEKSERAVVQNVAYKEVENLIANIEHDTERYFSSNDTSLLQRALKDVIHKLKTFLTQAGDSAEAIDTKEEEAELQELKTEKEKLSGKLQVVEVTEKEAETKYNSIKAAIEADMNESREAEREVFRIVGEQREVEVVLSRIDSELSVIERDREEFKRELQEAVVLIGRAAASYFNFTVLKDGEPLTNKDIASEAREQQRGRRHELEKMKIRLEELGGGGDDIEKEYKEVKDRDDFLAREISDLVASVEKLESLIKDLTAELDERFSSGIQKIGVEFDRFFQLMFGGGSAKLVESNISKKKEVKFDEDEEGEVELGEEVPEGKVEKGIELDIKLPNKRVKGLEMLSGGERALTSIALIFAMSQVNPPLFIILDETDAALDEANSRRYGDMISALAEKSQLILITHNRETMGRAGVLYGVTMGGDGVSKLLSIKFEEAVLVAK